MRIWDARLLPYLPDLQFKGQLRELVAIMRDWRDKGKTNHLLINKVMEYPKSELYTYFFMYQHYWNDRYHAWRVDDFGFKDFAEGKMKSPSLVRNEGLFPGWHNDTYLNICMYNLLEKHLGVGKSRITDKEWARLCEGYKKITGGKIFGQI